MGTSFDLNANRCGMAPSVDRHGDRKTVNIAMGGAHRFGRRADLNGARGVCGGLQHAGCDRPAERFEIISRRSRLQIHLGRNGIRCVGHETPQKLLPRMPVSTSGITRPAVSNEKHTKRWALILVALTRSKSQSNSPYEPCWLCATTLIVHTSHSESRRRL